MHGAAMTGGGGHLSVCAVGCRCRVAVRGGGAWRQHCTRPTGTQRKMGTHRGEDTHNGLCRMCGCRWDSVTVKVLSVCWGGHADGAGGQRDDPLAITTD